MQALTPSHKQTTPHTKHIGFFSALGMMLFWPGRSSGRLILLGNLSGDRFFKLSPKKDHASLNNGLNKQADSLFSSLYQKDCHLDSLGSPDFQPAFFYHIHKLIESARSQPALFNINHDCLSIPVIQPVVFSTKKENLQ